MTYSLGKIATPLAIAICAAQASATELHHTEPDGTVIHAVTVPGGVYVTGSNKAIKRFDGQAAFFPDTFGTYDPASNTRTVYGHNGGPIYAMATILKQANERGEHIRLICNRFNLDTFITGCTSATTFFTGAENVCIGPDAVLNWHGASLGGLFGADYMTPFLTDLLPEPLRQPFAEKWSRKYGFGFVRTTAADLLAIWPKMKVCK